ncbi:MAG: hypothetical protein HYU64_13865 [Armatimonadetes bacterium]|nr:hypothetical protein [Armatimonadota bacterium]
MIVAFEPRKIRKWSLFISAALFLAIIWCLTDKAVLDKTDPCCAEEGGCCLNELTCLRPAGPSDPTLDDLHLPALVSYDWVRQMQAGPSLSRVLKPPGDESPPSLDYACNLAVRAPPSTPA